MCGGAQDRWIGALWKAGSRGLHASSWVSPHDQRWRKTVHLIGQGNSLNYPVADGLFRSGEPLLMWPETHQLLFRLPPLPPSSHIFRHHMRWSLKNLQNHRPHHIGRHPRPGLRCKMALIFPGANSRHCRDVESVWRCPILLKEPTHSHPKASPLTMLQYLTF